MPEVLAENPEFTAPELKTPLAPENWKTETERNQDDVI